MLAAWRRYWFTPASLTDLGVSRAVLAGIVLVLNGTTRFVHVGMAAPALWTPVPILGLLHVPQPVSRHAARDGARDLDAAGADRSGRRDAPRAGDRARARAAAGGLHQLAGQGDARDPSVALRARVLHAGSCDRGFSLGAMWRRARRAAADPAFTLPPVRTSRFARWPLDLLFIVLAAYYALAGTRSCATPASPGPTDTRCSTTCSTSARPPDSASRRTSGCAPPCRPSSWPSSWASGPGSCAACVPSVSPAAPSSTWGPPGS